MTPPVVHDYLRELGKLWTHGAAMELGCWLGATSVPLLEGLVKAGYDLPFWAFDRWQANEEQVEQARLQGEILTSGEDLVYRYIDNVKPIYGDVRVVKGRMPQTLKWFDDKPISICIFDAPKKNPVFIQCIERLLPNFIPGETVWGLLDFHFWEMKEGNQREKMKAPVEFIHQYDSYFEKIAEWKDQCSCVFFRYTKKLEL